MIYFMTLTVFLALAIAIYARFIEPLRLDFSTFQIDLPNLPLDRLSILHLTDLHLKGRGTLEKYKLNIALDHISRLPQPPDLILITGDFIEDDHGIQAALDFIKDLPTPRLGIFASLGNHDYVNHNFSYGVFGGPNQINSLSWLANLRLFFEQIIYNKPLRLGFESNDLDRLVSGLQTTGVTVLCNQNIAIPIGSQALYVLGLDDIREGSPDSTLAVANIPADQFTIVLAHNPDLMQDANLHRSSLAFCGHVHGGQIRIPVLGPFYTHGSHLPRHKTSGWFSYGQTRTFISRGFGEGTPLRFNCRPEFSLIEIRRERQS